MFWKSSKAKERDAIRQQKIEASQKALLEAATATADAAHIVTNRLKQHLEDSIRQFESTARILRDALIICDTDGMVQTFNPAAESMFGMKAKDAISKSVLSLFTKSPNHPFETPAELFEAMNGGGKIMGIRADGTRFTTERDMALLERTGRNNCMLLLIRRSSKKNHHESIFELSHDGIAIVQDNRIVAVNPAVGRMFGYRPDDLLDKPVSVLVPPTHVDRVDSEDDKSDQFEAQSTHKDGRPLDVMFTTAVIHWNDEDATLLIIKDVSDMRRLESMLKNRNSDSSVDMICCYGPDFIVTYVNESFARFYNNYRDQMVGKDIRTLVPENEKNAFILNLANLTPDNPTRRMQLQVERAGQMSVQDWFQYATFDKDGSVIEYQRVGRDITDVINSMFQK